MPEISWQDKDKISHIVKRFFKENSRNQKGITNKYYTWPVLVKKNGVKFLSRGQKTDRFLELHGLEITKPPEMI